MKERLLIFDFDGTIADTRAVYYHAIGNELRFLGYKEKDIDRAVNLGLSLKKTLKNLGLGFLTRWFLHARVYKRVKAHSVEIRKCRDVDSIRQLKDRKILVTNSLKEFALPILKHLKLREAFSEIYGSEDFDDKAGFISNYLKTRKMDKKQCYYIGDRVADIKLARKVGVNSVVIAGKCAWDSRQELLEAKPDFILDDIKSLRKIL